MLEPELPILSIVFQVDEASSVLGTDLEISEGTIGVLQTKDIWIVGYDGRSLMRLLFYLGRAMLDQLGGLR